jgi:hypothetical protein
MTPGPDAPGLDRARRCDDGDGPRALATRPHRRRSQRLDQSSCLLADFDQDVLDAEVARVEVVREIQRWPRLPTCDLVLQQLEVRANAEGRVGDAEVGLVDKRPHVAREDQLDAVRDFCLGVLLQHHGVAVGVEPKGKGHGGSRSARTRPGPLNDSAGHLAGDALLRLVGRTLIANLRPYDVIVRYGGDEFLCAMPDIGAPEARARFLKICHALAAVDAEYSLSFGLAQSNEKDTLEELIARADADLLAGRT